jgi:actin-related protein 8
LFANILVVGGTSQIDGLAEVLEQRVSRLATIENDLEKVEVVKSLRKDLDPRFISWRGAAVLCALDSVRTDCWLTSAEWDQFGITALKEKVPFVW